MNQSIMDAIIYKAPGKFEFAKRSVPQITKPDEIKLKILAASICGTDVHILHGNIDANPDIILGHECVGEVVEKGEGVSQYEIGDHVILDNNIPCGSCPACQTGNSNLCTSMSSMGVHIDGVFSQYAVVPARLTVKIPADLSMQKAIFAEPLNCVMGAVKKLKVMPGDTALVLGAGPIGLYFTTMLKKLGAGKVLVSEVSDFRTQHALTGGADKVINPAQGDLKEAVLAETGGHGADIVIDAVGTLLPDAIRCAANGGSLLLFGMNANARQEICQNDITSRGLTVYGNYIGNYTLQNVANMLAADLADFSHMITHELPLSKFETGLAAMQKGEAIEVILYPFADE